MEKTIDFDFSGLDFAGFEKEETSEFPPDSFEHETKEEISDFLKALKKRAKEEGELKKKMVSTEYWFAVYFADQDQRDDFLRKLNLLDKLTQQYVDGKTFAKAVGVEIENREITEPKAFRSPADIDDLIMDIQM